MSARASRVRNRLVSQAEACAVLNISRWTFRRKWRSIFSDPRPAAERHGGVPRDVREDELNVAVSDGHLAVLAYRRSVNRTAN